MPEGANTTLAVQKTLGSLLKNRHERKQLSALGISRAADGVNKRLSGAIASSALCDVIRMAIVGPVGAGKTSLATSLAIALGRHTPCWSAEIQDMFDTYRVRAEKSDARLINDRTTTTPYDERQTFGGTNDGKLVLCDLKGLSKYRQGKRRIRGIFGR